MSLWLGCGSVSSPKLPSQAARCGCTVCNLRRSPCPAERTVRGCSIQEQQGTLSCILLTEHPFALSQPRAASFGDEHRSPAGAGRLDNSLVPQSLQADSSFPGYFCEPKSLLTHLLFFAKSQDWERQVAWSCAYLPSTHHSLSSDIFTFFQ